MSKIDTYTHTHLHTSAGSFLGWSRKVRRVYAKSSRVGAASVALAEHG